MFQELQIKATLLDIKRTQMNDYRYFSSGYSYLLFLPKKLWWKVKLKNIETKWKPKPIT